MIAKSYIQQNLDQLNSRFNKSSTPKDNLYFSKIAIMELCGWVEISVDDLMLRIVRRNLKIAKNYTDFADDVIANNYGFKYKRHFRYMLIQAVGIINVEKIEKQVDSLKKARLESQLNNLSKIRNELAHTYVKGTQYTIDAPSVTRSRFDQIYEGLIEYDKKIFRVI